MEEGRWMIERYVALVAANAVSPAALTHYAPPQSGLRPASSPEGEAFNLPLRGRGTAAAVDEGPYGRERLVSCFFRITLAHYAPPQSGLRPASSTFYGIAATGSYVRFHSLRDAPPGGEALSYRSDP